VVLGELEKRLEGKRGGGGETSRLGMGAWEHGSENTVARIQEPEDKPERRTQDAAHRRRSKPESNLKNGILNIEVSK